VTAMACFIQGHIKLWRQSERLDVHYSITASIKNQRYVVTSVDKCARVSYIGAHWLLYISTTDATTYLSTDAFCIRHLKQYAVQA
jgi:hypothetical protein